MKKFQTVLLSVSFLIIAIGFIILLTKGSIAVSEVLTIYNKSMGSSDKEFSIEYVPGEQWVKSSHSYGGVFDFTFFNDTNYNLDNWEVTFDVPEGSYIDSAWDCDCRVKGSSLIISTLDYNYTAFPDDSRKFGFVLYTPDKYSFTTCTLTGSLNFDYTQSPWWDILRITALIWVTTLISIFVIDFKIKAYKRGQVKDRAIILQSITTFVNFVDAKDPYTRGHSARVALYSKEIGRRLLMREDEVQNLYYIALMHDVGKISIPDTILNKSGSLTVEEREIIKSHTTKGGDMLASFTAIDGISNGALYHHERYDGKGYPKGLNGTDIPIYGRIICVADAFDAMSSNRCYRQHLDLNTILHELSVNSGTQFDPSIVKHMINMINEGFTAEVQEQYYNFNGEN